MNYYIELSIGALRKIDADTFDSFFDSVADALYECDGVEDADLSSDFGAQTLTFTMNVKGVGKPEDAMASALNVARTALHAAGGATPDWEKHFEFLRQTIENQSAKTLVDA